MKKLIFILVKFILGSFAIAFGFFGMLVLFVLALPIAGWIRLKRFIGSKLWNYEPS